MSAPAWSSSSGVTTTAMCVYVGGWHPVTRTSGAAAPELAARRQQPDADEEWEEGHRAGDVAADAEVGDAEAGADQRDRGPQRRPPPRIDQAAHRRGVGDEPLNQLVGVRRR